METLQGLYEEAIKDIYSAEQQFLAAMPELKKAAQAPGLKAAIEFHIAQSEVHVRRLEHIATIGGFAPTGRISLAAVALVAESSEHLLAGKPGPTRDAAIIACAQKYELYEICSYGTVITWAEALDYLEVAPLLQKTLKEEQDTDELLSDVSVLVHAAAVDAAKAHLELTKPTPDFTATSLKVVAMDKSHGMTDRKKQPTPRQKPKSTMIWEH